MTNAIDDLKSLRNWTLGIIGFATTVAAVLTQVFHFRVEPTILVVAAFACSLILIVNLIKRSEDRQNKIMEDHKKTSEEHDKISTDRFDAIDKALLEIRKSTLRTEMNNEIARHPENHDTILEMAEKYFGKREKGGLDGNWIEIDLFHNWMASEAKQGRPVHIPGTLELHDS
jgi:hypothetical protein